MKFTPPTTLYLLNQIRNTKWSINSQSKLNNPCHFCFNASLSAKAVSSNENICNYCQCPPEICNSHGLKGFVGKLISKYNGNTMIKTIPLSERLELRNIIDKYIKLEKEQI